MFWNNEHPSLDYHYFFIFCNLHRTSENNRLGVYQMVQHPTWILLDGHDSVCTCAVTVLYHIHYINSDIRCNFLCMDMKSFYTYAVPTTCSFLYLLRMDLHWIWFLFFSISTTFLSHSFVEGCSIYRVSLCLYPMITSQNLTNRTPFRDLVK